ncbi:ZYRO0C04862p [Zygosaccharomyces rouxii]|uniref:Ubiquitin-like protein ATG12 n=1 Tax=Zygosaccharomyces rouxii (strain ATCC 2623 / CBS 732 / NBRC 1130 / NCYC 568 / NRRL Y-229) TaxID=559307 RepID=C5DT25_ZYGRC|nr:uncharacterized protein ZYRO0C04862g [Zygosaccharomyces rouxii]CAR26936.1 ZYRO0C04862p [Zygosaccharomyces rouxii]
MSGILESESDNDDSLQSSTVSSVSDSLRQQQQLHQEQQQQQSSSSGTPRNATTGNLVQSRLEHYSRRLSMLGLDSSQEVVAPDANSKIEPTNVIESDDSYEPTQDVPISASLQLHQLPQVTNRAIEKIEKQASGTTKSQEKVQIRFQPIGSISQINPSVCKITATQPFSLVVQFLKKRIKVDEVFCYINNSFAPNPQLIVGNLWSHFKVGDELIVSYCGTTAFG